MNFIPPIAFESYQEIGKFQLEKLTGLLEYLAARSPFYKRLFSQHKVDIAAIRSLQDLPKLPVTTKDDIQTTNWDFLCVPRSEIAEYTSTSGTLGKPVTIALTPNDVARLGYNEALSFACADGLPTDLYQLMLTLDRQFMAGLAYYEGIRRLGAGLVRVGAGLPAMQWETIARLQPTAIVAVPSFIIKLLEFADDHKIDYRKSSIRKIICIGEAIRTPDFTPNTIARRINEAWNVKLYGTYASTEMQTAFTECTHGKGGHSHPELLIVEALNEHNEPVKEGIAGEITITTLGVEGMPLLRYKTGDMAQLHDGKCDCGRTTTRIGPVIGRKQQMLKLRGATIYPPSIFDVLNNQPEIHDYVVEAFTGELGTDEVRIHIALREAEGRVLHDLTAKFQSTLRVIPTMMLVGREELEALNRSRIERKVRKFIDSRVAPSGGSQS